MPKGIITKWIPDRAFGFADNYEGGSSVFLHISGFVEFVQTEEIRPGMKIEFDIEPQPDHRTKAVNVQILEMLDTRVPAEVKTKRLERN